MEFDFSNAWEDLQQQNQKQAEMDALAVRMLQAQNPTSIKYDREYLALIYEVNGHYAATIFVPLGDTGGRVPRLDEFVHPQGAKEVAIIHTHGRATMGGDGEKMSNFDKDAANTRSARAPTGEVMRREFNYAITPTGRVLKYDGISRGEPMVVYDPRRRGGS